MPMMSGFIGGRLKLKSSRTRIGSSIECDRMIAAPTVSREKRLERRFSSSPGRSYRAAAIRVLGAASFYAQ